MISSATTAAAEGEVGKVAHDPFAMALWSLRPLANSAGGSCKAEATVVRGQAERALPTAQGSE
jgi:hypothetical protein